MAGDGARSRDRSACDEVRGQRRTSRLPRQSPTLHLCSSLPAFGETRASKRRVEPSLGGCNLPVRSMKRSLPRREDFPRKGPTGSRARWPWAKAREGVKSLEGQPRRTPRRMGRGTVAPSVWEQERPVSAPAARPCGRHPRGAGSDEPYKRRPREVGESGAGVGAAHSTAEPATAEARGREGAALGRGLDGGKGW